MPPRGRRTKPKHANRSPLLVAGIAALALAAVAAAIVWNANDTDASERFADVHALAIHPDDPDVLLVATHRGLMRGTESDGWTRVGATRDDLMGFLQHPTDSSTMWSSGHPENPRPGFSNLGVRRSTDGGLTWDPIALPGVDFHAMTISRADPDRLWGHAGGALHRSDDGGATWSVVNEELRTVSALAAHPTQRDRLLAASAGNVIESADGGRTWSTLSQTQALGLAIDPTDANVVYAATGTSVQRSDDGGRSWRALGLDAPGGGIAHLAVSPHDANVIYAATYAGVIHGTKDAGATWRVVHANE